MAYGWEGKKIRLVPLQKEKHLENALLWLNDEELTRWTFVGDLPLGRLQEEEFFDRQSRGGGGDLTFAVETLEGEHVGFSGVGKIDWRHGTGQTGTLIAPASNWGKGFGADSVAVRTCYAFDVLGLRLLVSEVMAENVASIKALTKAGYVEAGRIPGRFWARGAYRDGVILYLERERWAAGRDDRK